MSDNNSFHFLVPNLQIDQELELVLSACHQPEQSIWKVPAYLFQMVNTDTRDPMGRLSLRIGYTDNCLRYAGQIGYAVEPQCRGHHVAERAVRLILPLARRHGMDELWITSNPDNIASRRTLERLGAQYIETVDVPADYPGEGRQKLRYRLSL